MWVSEDGGAPATVAASFPDLAPRALVVPGSAVFPADPDPLGRRALLVSTEDRPDGAHVERLWVLPLEGTGAPVELASAQFLRQPEWTRDGAAVVFESDAASYRDLYRAPADGSAPATRLTDAPHGSFEPAISADGAGLAMGTSRDGNAEIWTATPEGGAQARLTDHPADDVRPAWLPDGRLSWISTREGVARVWLRDSDGRQRPLRQEERPVQDLDVAWSPLGVAAIATQSGPSSQEIELRSAHGGRVALLDAEGPDEHPAWSPDGRWLAFTSSRSGRPQVWVVDSEGREARQVSRCEVACWLPRWAPTPPPSKG